jgi:ribonucleotide reductase beta subunit family protein with ferritin-like domain
VDPAAILADVQIAISLGRLAVQLGNPKIYSAQNPFDFMDLISMEGKTNFFEKKVSEYSKPGVGMNQKDMEIRLDEEF